MDGDIPLWYVCGVFLCSTLYAILLSGAETAFSTLPKAAFRKDDVPSEEKSPEIHWLDDQEMVFASLIVGKTILLTLIFVSSVTVSLSIFLPHTNHLVGVLAFTGFLSSIYLVVLIEWLPRVLAAHYGKASARVSLLACRSAFYLFYPLVRPALLLSRRAHGTGFFSNGRNPYWLDEELHRVLELEETHELQPDEKEMISSIIEMSETNVREVMIPRVDMICAKADTDIPRFLELIREVGHSRIPIYREDMDHIVGVVYARDFLTDDDAPDTGATLEALARPPYFVPETQKVDELLREFQQEKIHLAIVVDEHGGTAGLVTLEDLLEEIVGEIHDEYDAAPPLYETLADGSVLVDAKLNIDELNEIMHTEIVADGFETVAGLVYGVLDHVPEPGEEVVYGGLRVAVREVDGQRIVKVAVSRPEPSDDKEE
ncbi:MAG: HlyC/CorC family transporter [candidate division Zixibacteria bacterium]|nr:HlyC/CorC family transporter [candidate division Zixibacteria bacterium]